MACVCPCACVWKRHIERKRENPDCPLLLAGSATSNQLPALECTGWSGVCFSLRTFCLPNSVLRPRPLHNLVPTVKSAVRSCLDTMQGAFCFLLCVVREPHRLLQQQQCSACVCCCMRLSGGLCSNRNHGSHVCVGTPCSNSRVRLLRLHGSSARESVILCYVWQTTCLPIFNCLAQPSAVCLQDLPLPVRG
jgi:hypothetical protein